MKKLLLFLLGAVCMPMTLSAQVQKRSELPAIDGMRQPSAKMALPKKEGEDPAELLPPLYLTPTAVSNNWVSVDWTDVSQATEWNIRVQEIDESNMTIWSFDDGNLGEWTSIDGDGDGRNWYGVYGTSYSNFYFSGEGGMASQSYANGALTPDNWLISPKIELKGTFSFYAKGTSSPFDKEHFAVFVSKTDSELESFTQVSEEFITTSDWTHYTIDLTGDEYDGAEGYVAIRHFNCSDMNLLCVDEIGFAAAGSVGNEIEPVYIYGVTEHPYIISGLKANTKYDISVQAVRDGEVSEWAPDIRVLTIEELARKPEQLTVAEVTEETATLEWVGNEIDGFRLRYREYVEMPTVTYDFEEEPTDWAKIDADNDGYGWEHTTVQGVKKHSGEGAFMSRSYYMGTALTPDNWLISPLIELNGTVSVWAIAQDAVYSKEHFGFFVATTGTSPEDFTEVSDEFETTGEWTEYSADLSGYQGQMGYIAIRHFNCTNQYYLVIDDLTLTYPREDGIAPGEWTEIDTDQSPYTIENLTQSTTYEAQVMAFNGAEESKWTQSVLFTTLEQPVVVPTDLFIATITETTVTIGWNNDYGTVNARYKKTSSDDEWTIVENVLDNPMTIEDLDPDTEYTFCVQAIDGDRTSEWTEPITFTTLAPSAISTVSTDNAAAKTFNLQGMKLAEKPTEKGIYIINGKKYVVK